jgi:multidrug efflux pump subunit AcrA (membrane-fusion protein)
VRQGQTLVRIDAADYESRVRQARAEVEQQRVAVLQAEEEAQLAREEFARFQQRQADGGSIYAGIDPDDYAARIVSPAAQTQRLADAEPSALALRQPQLEAARAALGRAQATLEDAQVALGRTTVQAPFDAVVRSEQVDLGSYVAPGQTLAQLYASDAVEVVVPLSEDDAALLPDLWALDAGQGGRRIPAQVFADYGPYRYRWTGYVDRAEAALDEQTRTINAVVRVPDPFRGGQLVGSASDSEASLADVGTVAGADGLGAAPPLLVGSFVDVRMQGASVDRYAEIPRRALRRGDEVWTVARDSILRKVPVRVLQRVESTVLVAADGALEAGERVVTSDLQAPTDGMTIRLASRVRADTSQASNGRRASN